MRKWMAWMMVAALLCTGCSARNADYYEQAQLYLGGKDYETAAYLFEQLGEYRDAGEYLLYARALEAMEAGDYALAQTNFQLVEPFKSSTRYLTYLEALALKDEGDLETARELFAGLGSFADSRELLTALNTAIPLQQLAHCQSLVETGAYDAALALLDAMQLTPEVQSLQEKCRNGILAAKYDKALLQYQQGRYEEAMAAFEALGDVLDAPARLTLCQAALYRQTASAVPTLENAEALMADFRALGDYMDSREQLEALERKFSRNLALTAAGYPVVQLGSYPVQESGAAEPLTWRVIAVKDEQAVLLCEQVLDAGSVATATDLPIDWGDAASAVTQRLPAAAELYGLPAEVIRAKATPYALAQGVRHHEDGTAWWWLQDAADSGKQQIVWYTGTILAGGVDASETVVGVRPAAVVKLTEFFFTEGEGTAEKPYR